MRNNWRLFILLAASAIVGVTAVAFARDLISGESQTVAKPSVTYISHNDDICPPNACSIVTKANDGDESQVIVAR